MINSLEYTLFVRDFVENILLSLNSDYKNYIDFSMKNSILKTKIDKYNIDTIISNIAYNLLIKGKQIVYIYDKDDKLIVSLDYFDNEKMIDKIKLKFPSNVMTNNSRKKVLKRIKRMNIQNFENNTDSNYPRDSVFLMDLIQKKYIKLTKDYTSVNSNRENCTDQYILFREIRKRKKQTILVNYIFNELNKSFHRILQISEDDNMSFVSLSLKELDLLEDDLVKKNKKVEEILKKLYPHRIR